LKLVNQFKEQNLLHNHTQRK